MAAVLHLPTGSAPSGCGVPSREDAEAGIAAVLGYLESQPARLAVPLSGRYRNRLQAFEALKLASTVTPGGDTKSAEKIAGRNKASKRARKQAAKRAGAVSKNAALAAKMADGDLTADQVDLIADAAAKTTDAAFSDDSLIDKIAAVDPDQGKSIVADYVTAHANADQVQKRHDRQRAGRRVRRFTTDDDLDALLIAGDRNTIDRIEADLNRRSNLFYRQDGGRDISVGDHPRTADQRAFDAITDLILNDHAEDSDGQKDCNGNCGASIATNDRTAAGNHSGASDSNSQANAASKAGSVHPGGGDCTSDSNLPGEAHNTNGSSKRHSESACDGSCSTPGDSTRGDRSTRSPGRNRTSKRTTPRSTKVRPTIVVGVTLDKTLGLAPGEAATMLGSGPLADSVLAQYMDMVATGDADIIGAIYGQDGHPLWIGRTARYASLAQHTALVLRDKGCVLCNAYHSKCQDHHTMPWNAPGQGDTDIDEMALVCQSCHHYIHDEKQTLHQDESGVWKLRPALPHEIAPPRPPKANKGQAPQRT